MKFAFADGRTSNGTAKEGHGGTRRCETIARGILLRGYKYIQNRRMLQDIPSVLPEVQSGSRGE